MAALTHRPSPHVQMMRGLRAAKDRDVPFDEAWDEAWGEVIWPHDTIHRRQWKTALKSMRPEIEASYRDLPTRTAQLLRDLDLSVLLADDVDEVLGAPRALAA